MITHKEVVGVLMVSARTHTSILRGRLVGLGAHITYIFFGPLCLAPCGAWGGMSAGRLDEVTPADGAHTTKSDGKKRPYKSPH